MRVKKVSSSSITIVIFIGPDLALNLTAKSAQNTLVATEGPNPSPIKGPTHLKDVSKPDGEACNDDGTLKDASEIEWAHSPSQSHPGPVLYGEKRKRNDSVTDGDVDDIDVLPKTNVSRMPHSFDF